MTIRRFGIAAAVLGASAVALGAFGAHAMRDSVSAESLATWRTAVDYQFWHALALLATAVLIEQRDSAAGSDGRRALSLAGWSFGIGTLIFSGSLYGLVLGAPRWTGAITPLGGVILIVGWLALLLAFARRR